MKIFRLNINVDNFRSCFIKKTNLSKKELRNFCCAKKIALNYNEIVIVYDNERNFPIGDVTYCWDFKGIIINEKVKTCLEKVIKNNLEIIKFTENLYLLNNLNVINNALDTNKTDFDVIDNEIFGIKKFNFNILNFPLLFQITLPDGYIVRDYFVTEEFIKIVEDNHLTGFLFEEVWNSDKE